MKKQPETITLRRVDPDRWAALCGTIRTRLEPRLIDVGELLTSSELSLGRGEEQAAREYQLALDAYAAAGKLRCFYNPLHGAASHAGPHASHKPKKRQRRNLPSAAGLTVPMCADCRHRLEANLPLDVLMAAVSVRVRRRSRALVEVPYFMVPHDRSIWSATGYGSLPGSSDADLVRRVMHGEYRQANKGS